MRIKWLSNPIDPTKNGAYEHVAREFAIVAIGYKQAEVAPYKNAVERLNDESKFRTQPGPGDTAVDFVGGEKFSIANAPISNKPCILRKHGSETDRIMTVAQAKACKVPPEVIAQFKRSLDAFEAAKLDGGSAGAAAKARAEQAEYNERIKSAPFRYLG
ncbi:MAG: hypothetical protein WBW83_10275 [Terriglobales bacterium]